MTATAKRLFHEQMVKVANNSKNFASQQFLLILDTLVFWILKLAEMGFSIYFRKSKSVT
jgi:hypothetical protein